MRRFFYRCITGELVRRGIRTDFACLGDRIWRKATRWHGLSRCSGRGPARRGVRWTEARCDRRTGDVSGTGCLSAKFGKDEWDIAIGPRRFCPADKADCTANIWAISLVCVAAGNRIFHIASIDKAV